MNEAPSASTLQDKVNQFKLDVTVNTVTRLFYAAESGVIESSVTRRPGAVSANRKRIC
jgi:hypothetical protein